MSDRGQVPLLHCTDPWHSSLPQSTGHTSLLRKLCPWRDPCPTASPRQGCCTSLGKCIFLRKQGLDYKATDCCCRVKGPDSVLQLQWVFVFSQFVCLFSCVLVGCFVVRAFFSKSSCSGTSVSICTVYYWLPDSFVPLLSFRINKLKIH